MAIEKVEKGTCPIIFGQSLVVLFPAFLIVLPFVLSQYWKPELYDLLWRWYGVPPMVPVFADLRGITAPLECYLRDGISVYEQNPCDPWLRPYNYPRVWLLLAHLGINDSHTLLLGLVSICLFLVALAYLAGIERWRGILIAIPFAISPPLLLLLERANSDLLIFILLTSAVLVQKRTAAEGLLLGAAILKLYPCFAFLAVLQNCSPKRRFLFVGSVLVFGLYAISLAQDLQSIDRATASPVVLAYGFKILILQLESPLLGYTGGVSLSSGLACILGSILAFLAALGWRRFGETTKLHGATPQHLFAFQMGSSIFIGTYLLDSHFYYRLVFLLLCLPLLVHLSRGPETTKKVLGIAALLGLFCQFWFEYFPLTRAMMLDEWINLLMSLFLAFLLGGTIAEHQKKEV